MMIPFLLKGEFVFLFINMLKESVSQMSLGKLLIVGLNKKSIRCA